MKGLFWICVDPGVVFSACMCVRVILKLYEVMTEVVMYSLAVSEFVYVRDIAEMCVRVALYNNYCI